MPLHNCGRTGSLRRSRDRASAASGRCEGVKAPADAGVPDGHDRPGRPIQAVALGRRGEVDGRLGQSQFPFRSTDEFETLPWRRMATPRARGSALPTSSEAKRTIRRAMYNGVLAGRQHAAQPVEGGVRIAAAQAFVEGRNQVVVLFPGLVVEQRFLLQGLFDVRQRVTRRPEWPRLLDPRMTAASRLLRAVRASPSAMPLIWPRASGSRSTPRCPRPRSLSRMAAPGFHRSPLGQQVQCKHPAA